LTWQSDEIIFGAIFVINVKKWQVRVLDLDSTGIILLERIGFAESYGFSEKTQ